LEAKKNLSPDTFTVLVDKGHRKEIAQCINNNITTIVAILRQEEVKKVLLNPEYL
jgi:hypothetical protein